MEYLEADKAMNLIDQHGQSQNGQSNGFTSERSLRSEPIPVSYYYSGVDLLEMKIDTLDWKVEALEMASKGMVSDIDRI